MKAVLDACVLYPTVLREILLDVAAAGLFRPVWSARILDEWRHAASRHGLDAGVEIALIRQQFPEALADPAGHVLAVDLPDPADRHVAEAALAAGATRIVTANLRDFPPRALASAGLTAIHPDAFLCELFRHAPGPVLASVDATLARARAAGGDLDRKALMKRARLPRLAKAVERQSSKEGAEDDAR